MKSLVLGRGFLGKEFERCGFEVWGRDRLNINTLSDKPATELYDTFTSLFKGYDAIINCIAKSNTRWCEERQNIKEAIFINGYLPSILSSWCKEHGVKFVHISTGCLYDRTDIINKETEFLAAHCKYTLTKWIGENGLNSSDIVLRPRLLFSDIPDANNILCKLRKYRYFVDDMKDSLTCTSTIVGATRALLSEDCSGVYNVAQEGSASIKQIADWCGINTENTIKMDELRRIQGLYLVNNVMDISKLKNYFYPASLELSINVCYNDLLKNEKNKL